jgi:hypothetical protein
MWITFITIFMSFNVLLLPFKEICKQRASRLRTDSVIWRFDCFEQAGAAMFSS